MRTKTNKRITQKQYIEQTIGTGHGDNLVKKFEALPDQAKELFLEAMVEGKADPAQIYYLNGITCDGCKSPIEYVLYMALGIAYSMRQDEIYCVDADFVNYNIWIEVWPQWKIETADHTYYADFMIMVEYYSEEWAERAQDEDIIIECDGKDYHYANNDQVNHDYEREVELEKAGFKIMRFTGSQIYNRPMKCANDILDYLIAEVNRRRGMNSKRANDEE